MKIFIGSSSEAADNKNPEKNVLLQIAGMIRDAGAEPVRWDKQPSIFKVGRNVIENLEEVVNREHINAAIFIYSTDDRTWHRGEIKDIPRGNVVFEHGLFTGILGREKAITVKVGNVEMPSDLYGVTCIDYNKPEYARLNIMEWLRRLSDDPCKPNIDCITKNGKLDEKENSTISKSEELSSPKLKSELIELVDIPAGRYYRIIDDSEIIINHPLSISKYLITQSVYNSIMGERKGHFEGDSLPVENITFQEAILFCNKLSVKEGYNEVYTISGDLIKWNKEVKGYRLPFEVEWEYALGYSDKEINENLNNLAWYHNNSGNMTHEVGKKEANKYGIFDLLGNIWEWCFDNYIEHPPRTKVLEKNNKHRVLRGGSFTDFKNMFTKEKAFRNKGIESDKNKFTGFRVILQNNKLGG